MKHVRYPFFIMFILQFAASICNGQYYFRHYQVDDGLVHNSVTSVIQDRKGFIWIGTQGGLNRFDGSTFRTYLNQTDQFESIRDNIITVIAEDNKGMIWIGTAKGLFVFDPVREVLRGVETVPHDYISHIVIDRDNTIWLLAGYFLYRYDQQSNKAGQLQIKGSCIAAGNGKSLWIGNDDGMLSMYDTEKGSLTSTRVISRKVPRDSRSISKIYPINNHLVLVGCFGQGLKSYDTETGMVRALPLENNTHTSIYVRDITAGDNQQYWVATESGIYIYDLAAHTSIHLKKQLGDPYSISDNAVYVLYKDNRQGMWVGTYFGGLDYYSKQNARFEKYYSIPGINSISGDAIGQITSDTHGNLWIGTEDAGINKFDPATKKFIHYTAAGKQGGLSYPNIHGLLAVGDQLFIGPFFHGMEIMDMRTATVTRRFKFIGEKNDQVSDFITDFYLTRDSTLLVGTSFEGSGLFAYDRKRQVFKRIPQVPYNAYVLAILEDHKGNIWTGSVGQGTFYYNPVTGQHGNIRFGKKINNRILNEYTIRDIFEDSDQSIWFTTVGGGLIRLNADGKTFQRFTTKNGLPTNTLYNILEDGSKRLWISTLKGLVCFNLRNGHITVYTQSNGLITDQFNHSSAYKTRDGKMFFGSVKGMIAFHPEQFGKKESAAPVYITGFQIDNKEIAPGGRNPLSKSILYTDTLTLEHDQNNFSIEFAALDYASPGITRYRYIMKEIDKSWTYLDANRKAYFTDLAPGNYEFIVQAESNTGNWTSKSTRLFIRILPPFWKSNIAFLLYLLLIAAGLYFIVRSYHRYVEHKNLRRLQLFEHEKEKEIYQAKIEFFTNIAHEIRTPLTLIAGPIEWLKKKFPHDENVKKSLTIAGKNADRLVELTSQLLDFRKTEADQFSLNFVHTDVSALLADIITRFKQEATNNHIQLDLELPASAVMACVDREALIKICSNMVSNGIKYAATFMKVQVAPVIVADGGLVIRFCNDGKGIPEESRQKIFEPFFRIKGNNKPGTGIGLSLAKSLAELHNGSLQLISAGQGLIIFDLRLPVHQDVEFHLSNWKKI